MFSSYVRHSSSFRQVIDENKGIPRFNEITQNPFTFETNADQIEYKMSLLMITWFLTNVYVVISQIVRCYSLHRIVNKFDSLNVNRLLKCYFIHQHASL